MTRDDEIARLTERLDDREAELKTLRSVAAHNDRLLGEVGRLETILTARERDLVERGADVVAATAARDALIAEYQSLLKALDELRAAHATLTAREAAQVDLLRDRDVELARRVLEHERLKEELARHESMLARRQAAVEDQQATLARQQATIEHQQAILQQQQATLATIYGSLAWSVTNELRAVKDRSLGAPGSWQRRLYDRVAAAVRRRTGRRAGS